MANFRMEKDSMGEMKVPLDAYYGAQTQRAVQNFPISHLVFPRNFIEALGLIKWSCAEVAGEKKYLDPKISKAITKASEEVLEGRWDSQFVVDIFQTGSGTSTNMNANEVIANRAGELLEGKKNSKRIHPNDHVNFGQSSNDVFPTAMHLSILLSLDRNLLPSLRKLQSSLEKKAKQFDSVVKIGRTHLQDATPIRLGQVFSGYSAQVSRSVDRLVRSMEPLRDLALGGTAVGTGINSPPGFAKKAIEKLSHRLKMPLRETPNHFSSQSAKDEVVEISSALKTTAGALIKVANDIRWLASGPRCGIGEIILPSTQPGSSIMPGKVNPVIAESLLMVCAQVVGNDLSVTLGGQWGNFELNVMMPVMIHNVLESCRLLSSGVENFRTRCVDGIEVNKERCKEMIEKSLAMCTALAPYIGYDRAAEIAKEAFQKGKTVREIAQSKKIIPEKELEKILDPYQMTHPK